MVLHDAVGWKNYMVDHEQKWIESQTSEDAGGEREFQIDHLHSPSNSGVDALA